MAPARARLAAVDRDPASGDTPAMSEYDVFALHYDLEFADFQDDLPLYQGYAEQTGGPLLELGCGTGRLLLPMARAGFDVTGVDASLAMLERARDRLAGAELAGRVTLVRDDFRSLDQLKGGRYRLAFCAINSFLHLPDQAAQLAALRAVRRRLDPGSLLILDVFHPRPDLLATYDTRLVHEATFRDMATEERVDKFASRVLDLTTQTIHTTFLYDRLHADGRVTRLAAPFAMRYIHRYELALLLEMAGFQVEELLGDYDLTPFHGDSPHLIAVARPRA